MTKRSPFKTNSEIIRLAVKMYVRFPLSFRNVEDLLHERGVDVSYGAVRSWWYRFGPMFAAGIRKRRVEGGTGADGNGTRTEPPISPRGADLARHKGQPF